MTDSPVELTIELAQSFTLGAGSALLLRWSGAAPVLLDVTSTVHASYTLGGASLPSLGRFFTRRPCRLYAWPGDVLRVHAYKPGQLLVVLRPADLPAL